MTPSHVRALTRWQSDAPLIRVAQMLGVAPAHAYGLVVALTGYLLEGKSGELRRIDPAEIERAVGWEGEPGRLAAVLTDNYTDGRGVLLHWEETAGPILRDRAANYARVQTYRARLREAQDKAADDFARGNRSVNGRLGTGGNGAGDVESASHDRAASPAPPAAAAPDPTRARATPPASDQTPQEHGVTRDARSVRDVTGDRPDAHIASTPKSRRYDRSPQNGSSNVENVTGDSVMGDSHPLQSHALHRASRAVVQDLEPETSSQPVQRSQTQASNTAVEFSDGTPTRVELKMTLLTSALLGIPVEGEAGIDDLVRDYGVQVREVFTDVSRFFAKFYGGRPAKAVDVLNEMLVSLSPEGIESPGGVRLANVKRSALLEAMVAVTKRPPRSAAAAWPYVMRILENGRGNLELGSDGLTNTERASERWRRAASQIHPAVKRAVDEAGGAIARRRTTSRADEERTAVRWMLSCDDVKLQVARASDRQFRDWRQDLPGLDRAKDNWAKAEAVRMWKAAGRPLPLPRR